MESSVFPANILPTKKNARIRSGTLNAMVNTPMGICVRALIMVEMPLTPPGAISFGAVKQ